MIPFWHNGQLIECSRPGQPTYLQHCPVCGDYGKVRVVRTARLHSVASVASVIDCPQCQPASALWRVLDGVR